MALTWIKSIKKRQLNQYKKQRKHLEMNIKRFHKQIVTNLFKSPPGQNGRHFADDIFRHSFVNENVCILITVFPKVPIDNNPALGKIMAWRWIRDKPLSEQMHTRFTDANMRH